MTILTMLIFKTSQESLRKGYEKRKNNLSKIYDELTKMLQNAKKGFEN